MSKGQKIFLVIILYIYIALMVLLLIEGMYEEILNSIAILIGAFILGRLFARLGDSDE